MSIQELFRDLAQHGIKISASGDQLQVQAPKGALRPDLREKIAQNKAEILTLLREGSLEAHGADQAHIVPAPADRHLPFPLTDIQKAYWLGRTGAFTVPTGIHVYWEYDCVDLDIERLRGAFRRVVERHDMLRAHTRPDMLQIVEPDVPADIDVEDLRGVSPDERAARLATIREAMSHRIYDTERLPLYHIVALHLDARKTRLVVSLEGINVDGGSMGILFKEWVRFYESPDASPPALRFAYRDYVLALEERRRLAPYQRSFEYWQKRAADIAPAPALPFATDPANLDKIRFEHMEAHFDAEAWAQLKRRASATKLSPSVVCLTAYADVLGRFSATPRFTLNVTLFNRLPVHPEVNDIIGDFSSMLLITVDTETTDTFQERALRIQQQLWEAMEHREVSGIDVQREVARARGEHRGALFPVIFTSVQNQRTEGFFALKQLGELVYSISQTPQLFLDNQLFEQDGEAMLSWDHVSGVYPNGLVRDMFEAYVGLVRRLGEDDAPWTSASLDLLPESHRARHAAVNATDAGPLPEELVHASFERLVDAAPDKLAVITPSRVLTYGELDRLANQVAHELRARGIGPDKLVPIVMEKGWEQVVAVFGVLKAGGAYAPLDAAGSEERLRGMIKDSGARVVLTQPKYVNEPWGEGVEVLSVGDRPPREGEDRRLDTVHGQDNLAYVLYTSGSTGQPKGAMIEHRGLTNRLWETAETFGLGADDRVLGLTGLHHDLSVFDVCCVLGVMGGAIVLPDADKTRDPGHWAELIREHRVTLWNTVPAFMQMLVEHAEGRGPEYAERVASLRWVVVSGDFIPLDLPDRVRGLIPQIAIFGAGGPTETTLWNIYYPIGEIDPKWKSIPYGRPMRATRYYILDEMLRERPDWVPGEMYVGGLGLARGYWADEAKTRERFIVHPVTGERLYKTGDLGRWLPDGNIEILGRADFQVKIRGYRIELGEVEAAVEAHPGVKDAIVLALGEKAVDKRLCAYVVRNAEEGSGPGFAEALRAFLRHRLPEYMVPSAFVELDAMPLTSNGKVDRKALAARKPDSAEPRAGDGALPRNALEESLATVVRDVIGLAEIRVDQNFFEAGATSLQMVIMAKRLRATLGREIPITLLFQSPNISALAAALSAAEPQAVHQEKAQDRAAARRQARARR